MSDVLKIEGLCARIEEKEILKGVDLVIKSGEVHAIMGPNGTGKSTLSSVIMGSPKYVVTAGDVKLNDESILELAVDERARKGLFLAYQYPAEVPGVTNSDFIRSAMKATSGKDVPLFSFIRNYEKGVAELKMREDLAHRYLNEGFSGGEKKKNEILQMKMLKPKFAILDEIDSGLDVDALRIVGENINAMKSENFGALIITHYERFVDYIDVDKVSVLAKGVVKANGGLELLKKINEEGFDWLLDDEDEEDVVPRANIVGTCAFNDKKDN